MEFIQKFKNLDLSRSNDQFLLTCISEIDILDGDLGVSSLAHSFEYRSVGSFSNKFYELILISLTLVVLQNFRRGLMLFVLWLHLFLTKIILIYY